MDTISHSSHYDSIFSKAFHWLDFEILESLKPLNHRRPGFVRLLPWLSRAVFSALGFLLSHTNAVIVFAPCRLLFTLGEIDSKEISEVTLAHEFSLALSSIAVVSLKDGWRAEHLEGVCSQGHVTLVKAIMFSSLSEGVEPLAV